VSQSATTRGSLIDRRLAQRVSVTRRYLVAAVVVGVLATVLVIVQAVLLATVVARVMLHHGDLASVTPRLVALGLCFVVRAGLVWGGEAAAERTSATVTSELRRSLLRQALDLGPGWLAGERAGELSVTATRGISALDVYFGRYLPQAVLAALAPVVILIWVAATDWVSALILVALLAVVPVAMVYFGRRAGAETQRQWRRLSSLSARFFELIQGLPTLRALNRADLGRREVREATEGLRRTTMTTLRVAFLSALALELIAGLGVGLVAMVLGLRLLDGSVSLATALAVLLVSPEVFLPLRRAGQEFHASAEGQAAAQRVLDILDIPAPVTDGPADGAAPVADPDPRHHDLVFSGVRIAYPGRSAPAVADLDLAVAPGEHVALVGPSGAGKSSVLALVLGFVRPEAGSLRVGPVDLATVDPGRWRRSVTWVPQDPRLFRGSLADNLRLGRPDASPDDLRRVLEMTGLADLVAQLPAGLGTPVGEGGLALSAGQRSRLALARAVLRDAPVVLLDEPAAHLDRTTEAELQRALDPWLEGRTVLVAAHRTELVGRIDRVVALPGPEEPGSGAAVDGPGPSPVGVKQ
jgi:thiol reductant ABC exporter CydD subunit